MYAIIAITIVSLVLIAAASYYLNHKVVDHIESCRPPEFKAAEQAIIDDGADAPIEIDVVDTADACVKKVVKHEEAPQEPKKKTSSKKTTRKSQNNAKLRNKKI